MSLAEDVREETLALCGGATILSKVDVSVLLQRVTETFVDPHLAHGALWERLKDASGIHDPGAWRFVSQLLSESPVTMIIDDFCGTSAVGISCGGLVTEVLSRGIGFVFYVCRF